LTLEDVGTRGDASSYDVLSEYRTMMDKWASLADCSWRRRPCATPSTARTFLKRRVVEPAVEVRILDGNEEARSPTSATTGLPPDDRST